jgi:uridine kinase
MPNQIVVGIAGGSASGKSTLAGALAGALQQIPGRRPAVVAADRYMHKDKSRGPTFFSRSAGELMFNANHPDSVDWDRLLIDLEAQLRQGDSPDVILVEGLMVLHEPRMRQRLDLRLFVELDADERALRRLLRDMQGGRASRDPLFIANYYRESARVGHMRYVEPSRVHADLIVRGDADWERLRPLLLAAIEERLRHAATMG